MVPLGDKAHEGLLGFAGSHEDLFGSMLALIGARSPSAQACFGVCDLNQPANLAFLFSLLVFQTDHMVPWP